MQKILEKIPCGVVAGACGILCFYFFAAVFGIQYVFAQVNGKKHKIEGTERKCQKLNRHHRARVEQRGVDVGGIVKDVIDERQD